MKIPVARIEKFCVPEKEEQANPLMKCVWLDVEGERLLATDGHMAVRETAILDEADVTGLIPVEAFDLARKELKNISKATKGELPDPWLRVLCNAEAVSIENLLTNTIHVVTRPKLGAEQKFPNIDAVFPVIKDKPSVSLSADLLANVISALGTEGLGMGFWVEANDKAVVIACEMGRSVAVVMPMRGDANPKDVSARGRAVTSAGRAPQPSSPEAPTA